MKKTVIILLLVLTLFSVVAPPAAFADSGRECDENGENCICWEIQWEIICNDWFCYPWPVYSEEAC